MTYISIKMKEVISQAVDAGIPVSNNIQENVIVNNRAKTRFGCCKKYKNGYTIEVSGAIANGPETSLLLILAHEILHTCPGCQNHSKVWKAHAETMNNLYGYNIKRTSVPEELGIETESTNNSKKSVHYIMVCKGCGQVIERTRKSRLVTHTHLYRCKCGGKIERQGQEKNE
ncbi:MAG TPA: SprT-like domain-containing protein [Anaerovoracaceae bacterium]|nr:SprT-like domain-containing protein [Anaerovoracaceae bacterium]